MTNLTKNEKIIQAKQHLEKKKFALKKQTREHAIPVDSYLGASIDEVVDELIKCRNKGQNVYTIFNGVKLYSCDVTLDNAYLEVTGYTKEDFVKKQKTQMQEWKTKKDEEEKQAIAKIPYWIKEGQKYIPQEKWEDWEKCVEIRVSDLYKGYELDCALEIFEQIKTGKIKNYEDVEKILYAQNHSGISYGLVKSIIKSFSPEYEKWQQQEKQNNEKNINV